MSDQLQAIVFPSRFYAWALKTEQFSLNDDTTLITEGDEGKDLYVLIDGQGLVTTSVGMGNASSPIGAGQILGDMAFLNAPPWPP